MILGKKIIYLEIIALTAQLFYSSCTIRTNENSCPDNLALTNSGFEDGELKGWVDLGNSGISRDAHSGWKALMISDGDGGVQRFFHCTPGDNFTLTLYLKKEGNPSWAGFGIDFENLMGETLAENAFAPEITGECRQYSITRQAPDSTIRVEIWIYQQGESGSLFADDICFTLQEIK
jgi:hypothetical protein